MPKCPVCEEKVQKNWVFCPMCGVRLDSDVESGESRLDRLKYLWEREEGGRFIYSNFSLVKNAGVFPYVKVEPVRPELGDFGHINLYNLHICSLLYLNPSFTYEFYRIGKLMGYYSADEALKTMKLGKFVNVLNKTGLFWRIFQSKSVQKVHRDGWRGHKAADVRTTKVDKRGKRVKYVIKEGYTSSVNAPKPFCFGIVGVLCGHAEALFDGFWDGFETKCQCVGDPYCEVEIYLHESEEEPRIHMFSRDESNSILDGIIADTVNRDIIHRKEFGDFVHISTDQCINYLLLSLSPGHAILSKYAGKICGERIAKKAEIQGLENALGYLEGLFLYLKAGILRSGIKPDRVIVKMRESVYASGVNNIHMNLCIFLAGIIEGALNEATEKKWDVNEMKCIASGFSECEFWCKAV